MRRSAIVIGMLAAIFGLVFASGSYADEGGEMSLLALVGDVDGDGIPDEEDNCVDVPNEGQLDFDWDGVGDVCDNCSENPNPAQDDCDDDYCGNLCDCDYNQDGICGWPDFGPYIVSYGQYDSTCQQHLEPISPDRTVGFGDFGFFSANFGASPGPSGTTPGTVACPIW
jgi:hypothetical protein